MLCRIYSKKITHNELTINNKTTSSDILLRMSKCSESDEEISKWNEATKTDEFIYYAL